MFEYWQTGQNQFHIIAEYSTDLQYSLSFFTSQESSEGSTPPNDPASDQSSEPKTNGLSSSSILNNEKYKNLLINRSRLSGEEDNDEEEEDVEEEDVGDEGKQDVVQGEATTNGKQGDSISDEKEMVDGENAADTGDEVEDSLSSNQPQPDDVDTTTTNKDMPEPLVPIDQAEEHPQEDIYQSSTKVMRPSDDELSSSATSTPSPSSTSSPSFTAPRGGVDNVNANEFANDGNENGGGSDGLTGLNVGLDIGMKNANNDELNANLMATTGASSAASEEDAAENATDVGVNLSFNLDSGVKQQQATTLPEELAAGTDIACLLSW